jgi:hypothetical protein
MDTLAKILAGAFGAIFVAKMGWMLYIAIYNRNQMPDDDGGPVSGWGTPKG